MGSTQPELLVLVSVSTAKVYIVFVCVSPPRRPLSEQTTFTETGIMSDLIFIIPRVEL